MPNVLITGSNRGIGLSLAREFHQRGWTVFGTARDPSAAHELKQIAKQVYQLHVNDEASIQALAVELQDTTLDVVLNNAGVFHKGNLEDLKFENVLDEFKTNALGPILLARSLLPCFRRSTHPRLINMTSRMGSIADASSGGSYGYRASKCALNMMSKCWSIDVPDVPVVLVHPGFIQTGMTGGQGDMSSEECARCLMANIIDGFVGIKPLMNEHVKSGAFLHRDGFPLPW